MSTPPQPPTFPQPPPVQPEQGRSGGREKTVRRISLAVLLFLVAGIMIMVWSTQKNSPDAATTGDCVSRSGDDLKVVACSDAAATYKVVGRVENKTQVQFSVNSGQICGQFANAKSGYWKGEVGKAGYVLCLAPAK